MGISLKNVGYISQRNTPWEKHILHNINLEFEIGERVAFLGPSGSGKSTLFRVITGLLPATKGIIDNPYQESSLVFQEPHRGFFSASVWDEVAFGLRSRKIDKDIIQDKVAHMLRQVMISESYWRKSPFHLSGGEQRRLAIACAMVLEPKILLIDEPTVGLDGPGYEMMLDLLQNLKENKRIFLGIISHDSDFLFQLTERVVLLKNGQIVINSSWNGWKEICNEFALAKIPLPLAIQVLIEMEGNGAIQLPDYLSYEEILRVLRSFWKARRPR